MNILYAASTASHIQSFHLPILHSLKEKGHTVTTLAKGEGVDIEIPFSKKMLSWQNVKAFFALRRLFRKKDEARYDALILNTSLAAFLIRLALPRKNRPRVINFVHGYLFSKERRTKKEKFLFLCERLVRKKTDVILVMNGEDLEIASENALAGRVIMTRGCGVRHHARKNDPKKDADTYRIGFVGELSRRKNQALLVRAMQGIRKSIPNAHLYLWGDGAEAEHLRALTDEFSLSGCVHLMGHCANVRDELPSLDLYVSASHSEGLPFNIVEALDADLEIVASDVKGHSDILLPFAAGHLYPNGEGDALVRLVEAVYRGECRATAKARQEAFSYFSFENAYPLLEKIILEVIQP